MLWSRRALTLPRKGREILGSTSIRHAQDDKWRFRSRRICKAKSQSHSWGSMLRSGVHMNGQPSPLLTNPQTGRSAPRIGVEEPKTAQRAQKAFTPPDTGLMSASLLQTRFAYCMVDHADSNNLHWTRAFRAHTFMVMRLGDLRHSFQKISNGRSLVLGYLRRTISRAPFF